MTEEELTEATEEAARLIEGLQERRGLRAIDLVSVELTLLVNLIGNCPTAAMREQMIAGIENGFRAFVEKQVALRMEHETLAKTEPN